MTGEQTRAHDPTVLRRASRLAALITAGAGIGFGVLAVLSWWLLRNDRSALSMAEDPWAYYVETGLGGSTIAGLYLLPFSAILFLWFIVALRGWIRGTQVRRNMLISDLQLVSGLAFTAVFLVGSGATATALVMAGSEEGEVAFESLRALATFGDTLMSVIGVRMAAVFVLATSSLGVTTSVLPRWFYLLGFGFGLVLMLAPIVTSTLIVAFPVWVAALATMLLWHLVRLPEDELPGFAERYPETVAAQGRSGFDD